MDDVLFEGALIGGLQSSGSTLLSLLLDSHPDLICGPELTLFSHPLLWMPGNFNTSTAKLAWFSEEKTDGILSWSNVDKNAFDYFFTTKPEIFEMVGNSKSLLEFAKQLFKKRMEIDGAVKWVEKTPQNIYSIDAFLRSNQHSTAIITIRDPRGTIVSLARRSISPYLAARIWVFEASIVHALITNPDYSERLQLVRYEDLIADTNIVLKGLCDFLHVPEKVQQMLNTKESSRRKNDTSMLGLQGQASGSWLLSPFEKISDKSVHAWKKELKADVYDYLIHQSVNEEALNQYVNVSDVLPVPNLMNFFGYSCIGTGDQENYSNNSFKLFFNDKTNFNINFEQETIKQLFLKKLKYSKIVKIIKQYKQKLLAWIKRTSFFRKNRDTLKKIWGFNRKLRIRLNERINKLLGITSYNKKYTWDEPNQLVEPCDLVVVIAFSGRHKILHAVINEIFNSLKLGINVSIVLACTEKIDYKFAQEMQLKYKAIGIVNCENNPLGNKWYIAVKCARTLNSKALVITGSDDLLSADYLYNNYQHLIQDELDVFGMVGPRVWYMLDYIDCKQTEGLLWQLAYRNDAHLMPLGAGRIYRAEFLNKIDWQIFDRNLNALLDDKGYEQVLEQSMNVYNPTVEDGIVLSVKGAWESMNPTNVILNAPGIVATEIKGDQRNKILDNFSESLSFLK